LTVDRAKPRVYVQTFANTREKWQGILFIENLWQPTEEHIEAKPTRSALVVNSLNLHEYDASGSGATADYRSDNLYADFRVISSLEIVNDM
jgi:hypothetical protein